jgi:glycosyltransferase involved in cell wall biosynthesis
MIKKKYKYDISIAILNYNRAQFLDRAVRSCLDQYLSGKTKELIIVDDASNDESIDFLNSHKKKYDSFKLIVNKKNKGPGYCSNLAIKNSQGKYFIRVDSDDYLNRFAVDIMADILNYNEDFGYVYCDHFKTDNWGLKQKIVKLNSKKVLLNHGAGILFRTDLIKKVGNYNPSLREAEDYELISKLNKICNSFYLPLPLYRYYMHENNISKSGKRSEYIKIIKKNEKNI